MKPSEHQIQDALAQVAAIVAESNHTSDINYFNFHKERYLRMIRTVTSLTDQGAVILNIGSHYLHTSLLFKFLGYDVYSMDVGVFWELDFVQKRAGNYELKKIIENDLESFKSQETIADKYDVILFAEILEHITFNPVLFWKTIYTVLKPAGFIYISTPNSLNLYNIARTLGRILTFRGIGLPVEAVFSHVTYGHHWKEYSAHEIKSYFSRLSNDFLVHTSYYNYRKVMFGGFNSTLVSIFSFIGNLLYFFSDELEVIVKVRKTGNWKIEVPNY